MRQDGGWLAVECGHTYAMHHCQRGWEFKARKEKGGREESEMASEPTIRHSMCPAAR